MTQTQKNDISTAKARQDEAGNEGVSQHYRLTLQDAIAHYQQGDLTAKGLLHFYLKIRLKPGWTLRETQKEICQKLGISRAAFYSALSRLRAEGSIQWTTPANTQFSISLGVCECRQQSTSMDEESTFVDSVSTNVDEESTTVDSLSTSMDEKSTIVENKSPKSLPDKGFSDSPNSSSNSFQFFFNSLSEETRESFLANCKYEASRLPKPVVLLDSWIAAHYQELWSIFIKKYPRFDLKAKQQNSHKNKDCGSDKNSAAAENSALWEIQEAIADGRLHPRQNQIERGFVILPNGDAMFLSEWLEGAG